MPLELFEGELKESLKNINLNLLQEVRLRENANATCLYNGEWYYISKCGLDNKEIRALKVNENQISKIIQRASNNSLYTVSEQIKKGFITFKNGIRIGLSGSCVYDEKGFIKSITKINSLCIRIPHIINNSSNEFIKKLNIINEPKNILIISPPGCGKTTILKDIASKFAQILNNNLVVVDEKDEFLALKNKGLYLDIISGISKSLGVEFAIRNLNPKIIITDEIGTRNDYFAILKANFMGSYIICSKHGKSIADLKNDTDFVEILNKKIFDYYVLLDNKSIGKIKAIYNECLNLVINYE